MRTYLVVLDETPEARIALRFAARRASKTGGSVEALVIIHPPEFVQWGGVQAAIEEEARQDAENLVSEAAGEIVTEFGRPLAITVREGNPMTMIAERLAAEPLISALVLGAAASGPPGPLVSHFTQTEAGSLTCPLMIIPGSLTIEQIDNLA